MSTDASDARVRHSSHVTHCLFVYGTLTDDDLVTTLTGQRFIKEAAVLAGYRKLVPDDGYAFIVPEADAVVEGFLLRDLDEAAVRALDQYEDEGHLYQRTPVVVRTAACQEPCMTYVGIAAALTRSTPAG